LYVLHKVRPKLEKPLRQFKERAGAMVGGDLQRESKTRSSDLTTIEGGMT